MKANIVSLEGVTYQDEAISFTVMTTDGEITILNNHRPLLTVLATGIARLKKSSGEQITFAHTGGFLEYDRDNTLTVLIDKK